MLPIVLAVLTWIGSGADLVGLLREWYKDKRERESIPKLDYGGIFARIKGSYNFEGKEYPNVDIFFESTKFLATVMQNNVKGFSR